MWPPGVMTSTTSRLSAGSVSGRMLRDVARVGALAARLLRHVLRADERAAREPPRPGAEHTASSTSLAARDLPAGARRHIDGPRLCPRTGSSARRSCRNRCRRPAPRPCPRRGRGTTRASLACRRASAPAASSGGRSRHRSSRALSGVTSWMRPPRFGRLHEQTRHGRSPLTSQPCFLHEAAGGCRARASCTGRAAPSRDPARPRRRSSPCSLEFLEHGREIDASVARHRVDPGDARCRGTTRSRCFASCITGMRTSLACTWAIRDRWRLASVAGFAPPHRCVPGVEKQVDGRPGHRSSGDRFPPPSEQLCPCDDDRRATGLPRRACRRSG